MTFRNVQEFEVRCRTLGVNLKYWVTDILSGKLPTSYRDVKYLPKSLGGPFTRDTGNRLSWLFEPLRVLAVRTGGKVLLVDGLGFNADQRAAWDLVVEQSWMPRRLA